MAKYVFLNMPGWGHVNPTLAVVQELVRRGHDVSYYLTEEFQDVIQATGASFQPYESRLKSLLHTGINGAEDLLAGGNGPGTVVLDKDYVPPQVIDRIRAEHPDTIVYDFMCLWAKVVVETLHVPAVATRATYVANDKFQLLDYIKEKMQYTADAQEFTEKINTYKIAQPSPLADSLTALFKIFSGSEQLNIIFMPSIFQPMREVFDERYLFVGPSILPRYQKTDFPLDRLHGENPLLYISLGSVVTTQPEFYRHCFAVFGEQPWQVVLSTGNDFACAQPDSVPANFFISRHVPQLDILSRARVFITHAGTNSIMESLYYGVPMVLIPQQPEQQMHAARASELGIGVLLNKKTLTASTLREAVECVASHREYRDNAQRMQQIVHDAGGYQRAADAIVQFSHRAHAIKGERGDLTEEALQKRKGCLYDNI
jgi:MGT family glycosyltransferase